VRPVRFAPRGEDLGKGAHLTVSLKSEPVTLSLLEAPDVAHGSTAHTVGQFKNLPNGEHGTFLRMLVTGPADPAWVALKNVIFLGRGHQHRPQ
jgi:hypothetical protein